MRQVCGQAIASLGRIRPDAFGYRVPSHSGSGSYFVSLEDGIFCTCEDFNHRAKPCKHIFAVLLAFENDELADPDDAPRYSQPWATYDAAQRHEGDLFGPSCANSATPCRRHSAAWAVPACRWRRAPCLWPQGLQHLLDPAGYVGHSTDGGQRTDM